MAMVAMAMGGPRAHLMDILGLLCHCWPEMAKYWDLHKDPENQAPCCWVAGRGPWETKLRKNLASENSRKKSREKTEIKGLGV